MTNSKSSKTITRTMYFELFGAISLCFQKFRNDKTGSNLFKIIPVQCILNWSVQLNFVSKNAEMPKLIQNYPKSLPIQCVLNRSVSFNFVVKNPEMSKMAQNHPKSLSIQCVLNRSVPFHFVSKMQKWENGSKSLPI